MSNLRLSKQVDIFLAIKKKKSNLTSLQNTVDFLDVQSPEHPTWKDKAKSEKSP